MLRKNKIAFKELPDKIQVEISKILAHRKIMRPTAVITIGGTAVSMAAIGAVVAFGNHAKEHGLFIPLVLGQIVYERDLIKGHSKELRQEALKLHKALFQAKKEPGIKKILEKYPYVIVDMKGNLVGKKTAPNLMRIPIGRRRIISPKQPKNRIRNWRNQLPKISKRKR